jgi:hypothetical protein
VALASVNGPPIRPAPASPGCFGGDSSTAAITRPSTAVEAQAV